MSTTLLRLGLWTLILVLTLYVAATTYAEMSWAELIPVAMLQQVMVVSVALIVAGIVAKMFDRGSKVVSKNRCRVCRIPIPAGAIYCREHLRSVIADEDEKLHVTRVRR